MAGSLALEGLEVADELGQVSEDAVVLVVAEQLLQPGRSGEHDDIVRRSARVEHLGAE